MTYLLRALLFALVLLPLIAAEGAQTTPKTVSKQPTWAQLSPEQKNILAPLSKDWDHLPDFQQQRILATAKRYPRMKSVEQQRYSKRLLEWSKLPYEQRNVVRERFKHFQSLSPQQQAQLRRRWAEERETRKAQPEEQTLAPIPTAETETSSTTDH